MENKHAEKNGWVRVSYPPSKPGLYLLRIAETIENKEPYIVSKFNGKEWDVEEGIYPLAWFPFPKTDIDLPF